MLCETSCMQLALLCNKRHIFLPVKLDSNYKWFAIVRLVAKLQKGHSAICWWEQCAIDTAMTIAKKKKTKKARLLLQLREQIFWTFSGNFKTLCKWVVNFNNVYILNFGGTFKLKAERSIILLLNLSITIRQTMKPLVAAATKALCYPTCSCNLFTPNSCRTTWKAFFH